jgi:hypothetical protein
VALELEQQVLRPERLARAHHAREQLVQHRIPDLAPGFAPRQTQRARVLASEHGPVRVVVEDRELRPPEQDDLRLGRQHHADGAVETLGPGRGRPQRGRLPIQLAQTPPHLAATLQERELERIVRGGPPHPRNFPMDHMPIDAPKSDRASHGQALRANARGSQAPGGKTPCRRNNAMIASRWPE